MEIMDILNHISIGNGIMLVSALAILYSVYKKLYNLILSLQEKERREQKEVEDINKLTKAVEQLEKRIRFDLETVKDGLFPLAKFRFFEEANKIFKEKAKGEKGGKKYKLSAEERQSIDIFYKGYKALGGNGIGDSIYSEIKQIPVKPKGEGNE